MEMCVQVPQLVSNLIFTYSGRDFAPALRFRDLTDVERGTTTEN